MRRQERAISDEAAWAILRESPWGLLSMIDPSGLPYGVPLNYCMIGDDIYIHCATEGRKIDCLTANPEVSFCVVADASFIPDQFTSRYRSIIATGRAQQVEGEEKRAGLVAIVEKYSAPYMEKGAEIIERMFDVTLVYKIVVDQITGKAANQE